VITREGKESEVKWSEVKWSERKWSEVRRIYGNCFCLNSVLPILTPCYSFYSVLFSSLYVLYLLSVECTSVRKRCHRP
jgi:hypothetical protein